VKILKAFFLCEVSVPQANDLVNVELSHQVVVNPSKSKLTYAYVDLLEIVESLSILGPYDIFNFRHNLHDAWLPVYVVLQDVLEYFANAPKRVSFNFHELFFSHLLYL
jgi:hypothetical protein